LLDPMIGELLSPETISVTAICIAWAQFLGCQPILINGVDMAYTGNKRYAIGVMEEEELAFQSMDKEKSVADRIIQKKDREGNSVYSAVRWVMESHSIAHFAKQYPHIPFINTTKGGIGFEGIEYVPLKEAILPFKEVEIRKQIFAKINEHPMPLHTKEKIDEKMNELKESLSRLIHYLQVLAGEKKGSTALAEIELTEEMAYWTLFHDIDEVLKSGPSFWKEWLTLALKYEERLKK
jgi:hypothetical protein